LRAGRRKGVWNNKRVLGKVFTALVVMVAAVVSAWADDVPAGPKLLLSAQRLRRLKRDRERKTVRWVDFENRVNSVPDSPERGFELALYYVVTGDEVRGREAVEWAIKRQDRRVMPLVLDWCKPLLTDEQRKKLRDYLVTVKQVPTIREERDIWFQAIATGAEHGEPTDIDLRRVVSGPNYEDLYALCELIYAVRANTHKDLREVDAHFFSILPELLLLSAKPSELNSPPWMLHVAALALVEIDPNLPASQFLQSWALEDSQLLREGPGVAYELLWADPYLPGVGYQNMDTWLYDDHARLYARSGWEPNSCWVSISAKGVEQENCPPNWETETVHFGHLTLLPMTERCVEIPHLTDHNESVVVWKLRPGETVMHGKGKEQRSYEADAAGMWRPGANVEGRVCAAAH